MNGDGAGWESKAEAGRFLATVPRCGNVPRFKDTSPLLAQAWLARGRQREPSPHPLPAVRGEGKGDKQAIPVTLNNANTQ